MSTSSWIRRVGCFLNGLCVPFWSPVLPFSIGVDFRVHRLETKEGKKVKLSIWVRTPLILLRVILYTEHISAGHSWAREIQDNHIELLPRRPGNHHRVRRLEPGDFRGITEVDERAFDLCVRISGEDRRRSVPKSYPQSCLSLNLYRFSRVGNKVDKVRS